MDLLGLFEISNFFRSHHNRCKRQLFWNLHRSKTSQQVKKPLLPRALTWPLKNSAWKPPFLLKWPLFIRHSLILGGWSLLSTWNFTLIGNLQYCSSEKECNALAPLLRLRQPRRGFLGSEKPPPISTSLLLQSFQEKILMKRKKHRNTILCEN